MDSEEEGKGEDEVVGEEGEVELANWLAMA